MTPEIYDFICTELEKPPEEAIIFSKNPLWKFIYPNYMNYQDILIRSNWLSAPTYPADRIPAEEWLLVSEWDATFLMLVLEAEAENIMDHF